MSKFQEQLNKMSDQEVAKALHVLGNENCYELLRIVMCTPSHSRPIQMKAVHSRIMRIDQELKAKAINRR